ncbi:hypothetical protein WS58_20245 [Burkholderia pseudomultivorans]|nr:hypothetical protein WS56_05070 [Burkholderia pseudomultivorans]KVC37680.1 hypothetical protein WS55_28570 [Burkholderia pseudomultivorans]KVC39341.1 hypothetical protein WS58_20245 [Burkholderia pseudomultivorans]
MRINGVVATEVVAAVQMDEFRDESVRQPDLAGNEPEGIFADERFPATTALLYVAWWAVSEPRRPSLCA